MRNKNKLKDNLKRQRLLRFLSFTLGGVGLEGSYLQAAEDQLVKKPAGDMLA
ncbi:hypothetical protein [Erwinia pyrifoliae]|uniref:Uncharacterized protein n=1 Tax=Erwinia pyrifoliae TaxID=79967 RepID=A0ABY5XB58_ERWPY|nr:hypothetical protein [Erwinia pyrifoliae]MCT2386650.1 hypothetical protein [Erwinia pyrifoliae]MCU8587752.1 hypothetical protein [Erwinia pyrifoliae]UWS31549.1 hypothetical protein NYP81_09005 [Erwinia pyrifoliae]UWS34645.1 hypothetical protein NYP84_05635 [Erwinia pyrifoliae]UXK11122.1 hypothetical protein NYP80_12370 [Erwinia pyrifoliae]